MVGDRRAELDDYVRAYLDRVGESGSWEIQMRLVGERDRL